MIVSTAFSSFTINVFNHLPSHHNIVGTCGIVRIQHTCVAFAFSLVFREKKKRVMREEHM